MHMVSKEVPSVFVGGWCAQGSLLDEEESEPEDNDDDAAPNSIENEYHKKKAQACWPNTYLLKPLSLLKDDVVLGIWYSHWAYEELLFWVFGCMQEGMKW